MAGQKREARLRTDDRAIHDLLFTEQDVDARHKAGHDEKENKKAGSDPGLLVLSALRCVPCPSMPVSPGRGGHDAT
jgi:hypothetical protein